MGDRVGSEGRNGERSIDGALALLSFVVALVIGYLSQPEGLPFAQHYLFDGYRLGLSSGVTLMLAITMVAISSALVYLTTAHLVRLFASTDNDDGSRSESPATAPAAGFVAAITLPALAAVRGAAVDAAPSLLLLPLVTGGLLCMVLWYRGRGEKNLGGEKVAEDAVAEEAPSVPNGRAPLFLALAFAFALLGLFIDPITFALLPALLLLYWTTRFTGEADPLERPRSIALTGAIAAGLLVLWFAIGSMTAPDRIWAPNSEPFSTTHTEISWPLSILSWRKRIAADKPAGPPPTMTTSNSIASLSTIHSSNSKVRPASA